MPILGFSYSIANKANDGKNMDKWGLSAGVENIVGKGEIACNEQFLLFPQCFQKQSVVDVLKQISME